MHADKKSVIRVTNLKLSNLALLDDQMMTWIIGSTAW